jgi:hypothetical protein
MEKSKRPSNQLSRSSMNCLICGDVARGLNFSVTTCMSCKNFFRRNAYRRKVTLSLFKRKTFSLKIII